MIKIKTIGIWGFEGALRGCRMPYESFDKSDSMRVEKYDAETGVRTITDGFYIGEADMALCKKLIKGGTEHRKFLRAIHVQMELVAPRFLLTELDTYKVGTVRLSSSTMHLIGKRELTTEDFTTDDVDLESVQEMVAIINRNIKRYQTEADKKKKKKWFRTIKVILGEGFMQKIMFDCNYENLLTFYHQRKNHRLQEWSAVEDSICAWIKTLPYMEEFIKAMEEK